MADAQDVTGSTIDPPPEAQPSKEELTSKLNHLKASATQQYALKNYGAAAEFFSEAAEIQDQINGEMSPDNADLLYQYGRCLYHVGVSKSDVLGGKVAQQEEPKRKKRKITQPQITGGTGLINDALGLGENKIAEEVVEAAVEEKGSKTEQPSAASKPFFQITGDENWTDSEDEEDDEEGGEAEDEEDEDLAIAYEILDTARVLFTRKIEVAEGSKSSTATHEQTSQQVRQLKERLADTHDLQAEIKLENEQFKDAVTDARDALDLKLQLYPQESGLIAEAHYKLSIALDFASLPIQSAESEDGEQVKEEEGKVDEALRKQAAEEMEKAILSCQARIKKEEAELSQLEPSKLESNKRSIADAKDLVKDMRIRLLDLRSPVPAAALTAGGAPGLDGSDPLRGVLGQLLGESKVEQAKRIAEATQQANDVSSLVKHKKKPKAETAEGLGTDGKGKRKAGFVEDTNDNGAGKKVKFEGDV